MCYLNKLFNPENRNNLSEQGFFSEENYNPESRIFYLCQKCIKEHLQQNLFKYVY